LEEIRYILSILQFNSNNLREAKLRLGNQTNSRDGKSDSTQEICLDLNLTSLIFEKKNQIDPTQSEINNLQFNQNQYKIN
jgi:hypothetical protein